MNHLFRQTGTRRAARLAALFLVTLLVIPACHRDQGGEAELRYKRATRLLDEGNVKAAVVELKAATAAREQWAPAHRKLGQAYLTLGRYDSARDALARAASLAPEDVEIVLDLAEAEIHLDHLDQAKSHLQRYTQGVGKTPRVERLLGALAGRQGDAGAARTHLEAALAADPDAPATRLELARLAVAGNDLEEAARQLGAAAKDHPDDLQLQYGLAEVAIRQGDLGEANQILDRISKIDDQQLLNRLLKVENLMRLGHDDDALTEATSLATAYPALGRAHLLRGVLLLKANRLPDAVEALSRATAADGKDGAACFYLGSALLAAGKGEQARAQLTRATALRPDYPIAQALLAEAHLAVGDTAAAQRVATVLIAAHPELPMARLAEADVAAAGGDLDGAATRLGRLVADQPEWLEGRLHLARVEAKAGHQEAARAAYTALVEGGGPVPLYLEYGQFLAGGGAWTELLHVAEVALVAHPGVAALLNLQGVALAALDRGAAAEPVFRAALAAEAGHGAAAVNLAKLVAKAGREGEAIPILRAAIAANPQEAASRSLLADLLLKEGKAAEAIDLYEAAVKANASPRDLARLIVLYLRAERADGAVRTARRLVTEQPTLAGAHLLLVQALASSGRTEEALAEAQLLDKMASTWPPGLNQEAALLAVAKRTDEAIATWERSLASQPEQTAVHIDLARLLLSLFKGKEAVAHARLVVGATPADPIAHLLLGRSLEVAGDKVAAESAFERARSLAPAAPAVLTEIAEYRLRCGESAAAEALYEQVLKGEPRHAAALLRLAMIAEHDGHYDEAARRYRRLLVAQPEDVVGLNNLAWILADKLDAAGEAVTHAQEANRLKPDQWWLLDTWAWALGKAGEAEQGLRRVDQALAQRPDSPTLHYHRAVLLDARGDRVGAVVEAKRALEITSEFPEVEAVRTLLARLQR